jgi:hypothetical protein
MNLSKTLIVPVNERDDNKKKIQVSIIHYNQARHHIEPNIHVQYVATSSDQEAMDPTTENAAILEPSDPWKQEYAQWNCFGNMTGPTVFHSVKELCAFNEKGIALASRLRTELRDEHITIEPFKPLYSNVAVSDAVCGGWLVEDMNYGILIPIQNLPISNVLKSRLCAWKFVKGTGWNDPKKRHELDREARDLEEHLLWELNIEDMVEEGNAEWKIVKCTPLPTTMGLNQEVHLVR